MLFGLLSLLMDIFKIATYVGYLHCDSAVKVAFPVVQAAFLFVQVGISKRNHTDAIHQLAVTCTLVAKLTTKFLFLDLLPMDSCKGLCAATHRFDEVKDFLSTKISLLVLLPLVMFSLVPGVGLS